jgi:hypothetical protein
VIAIVCPVHTLPTAARQSTAVSPSLNAKVLAVGKGLAVTKKRAVGKGFFVHEKGFV